MVHQFKHFKTIDLWHLYIKKNKIRIMLLNCLYSFKTIITFLYISISGYLCKYSFTILLANGSSSIDNCFSLYLVF